MAILKRYKPGERLTAENVNLWEAAVAPISPKVDLSGNYYDPDGRYDIVVRRGDTTIAIPPYSVIWVLGASMLAVDVPSYVADVVDTPSSPQPALLLPIIVDGTGFPIDSKYGLASFAFTPVWAAIDSDYVSDVPRPPTTTVQWGADINKRALVQGKEGFFSATGYNKVVRRNGVDVIKVQRQPIYPTFIFGVPSAVSFGTTETYVDIAALYSFYNFNNGGDFNNNWPGAYIKRWYQVDYEASHLYFDWTFGQGLASVELTLYKRSTKDTALKVQLTDTIKLEAYSVDTANGWDNIVEHWSQTGEMAGSVGISCAVELDIDEYVTMGVKGSQNGNFQIARRVTTSGGR